VRRLLASDFPVESVLVARRRAEEIASLAAARGAPPVYVAPDAMMHEIIGYKFHSGVIACGLRKPLPTLEQVVPRDRKPLTLVVCPEISSNENLGSLVRISAAFGAAAMLLGERSADPFFRQSIRVSMGTIFSLPVLQSQDLMRDLARLKMEWDVELIASVLEESAEPLSSAARRERVAILFGNEAQGLSREYLDLCDRRVTIPMQLGTDSLNVAVAAGVFLYHFTR
jgi:tRNA G18 (ribose-2'-O)-methylase SpoU